MKRKLAGWLLISLPIVTVLIFPVWIGGGLSALYSIARVVVVMASVTILTVSIIRGIGLLQ